MSASTSSYASPQWRCWDHPQSCTGMSMVTFSMNTGSSVFPRSRATQGWPQPLTYCSSVQVWTVCSHLVIRHLLQIKVAGVEHLHPSVAIVRASEGTPGPGVRNEGVRPLSASLERESIFQTHRHSLHWGLGKVHSQFFSFGLIQMKMIWVPFQAVHMSAQGPG